MGQSVDSPTSRGGGYVHSVPRPRRMSEVPSGLWPAPACSPLVLLFRHRRRLCLLDLSLTFFEAGAPGAPAGAADSINSAQFPTGTQSKPHAPRRGPIPLAPRRRVPMPPNPGLAPPWAPPPGLSGPHPTAGPRPQPPGPKGRPRPLVRIKDPRPTKCSPGGGAKRPSSVRTSGALTVVSLAHKPRSYHAVLLSLAFPLTFPCGGPLARHPARPLEGRARRRGA